jgi:hypothetical protein
MYKRSKPEDGREPPRPRADERDVPVWADGDEEVTPGRNWTLILIFAVVPLVTLIALVLSLLSLFSEVFG